MTRTKKAGRFNLDFIPEPEDWKRGWISPERFWELAKAGVISRGDELKSVRFYERLGYLITTGSGYVVWKEALPDKMYLPKRKSHGGK